MGLLDSMLSGGDDRRDYEDFVRRYDRGSPYDDISDDEAFDRYRRVSSELSDDEYEESARDAFSRLSPDERREFGRYLRRRGRDEGFDFSGYDDDDDERYDRYQDPDRLARLTGRMRRERPGALDQLLGGGGGLLGGGGLGDLMGGGRRRDEGMLGSPLARAALGGIAAMAAQRMMSRR